MEWQITAAGLLGLALILAVSIYVYARLRIERERTVQKLIHRGLTGDELIRAAGFGPPRRADLRRGLLLMGVGVGWAAVTFFMAVRRGRRAGRRWRSVSSTCCCGRSMGDPAEPNRNEAFLIGRVVVHDDHEAVRGAGAPAPVGNQTLSPAADRTRPGDG